MPYVATIPEIDKEETIVLPISMNQPLEEGPRLYAILTTLKEKGYQSQVTLLLCDYLNRHNCESEEEAMQLGNLFLQKHEEMLQDFKIVRWKDFIEKYSSEFNLHYDTLKNEFKENQIFVSKINRTWKKCLKSSQSLAASIEYQIEEYATILCMSEFNHLIYPKNITDGMAFIFKLAHELNLKIPIYHAIKVTEIKSKEKTPFDLFFMVNSSEKKPSAEHIHIAFRGVLAQINVLMTSKELSNEAKQSFVDASENIFMSLGFLTDISPSNKEEKSSLFEV